MKALEEEIQIWERSAADSVQLTKKPSREHMSIATFGSCEETQQAYEIGMKLKDGQDKLLKMLKVPLICEPLSCQPITLCVEQCEHLPYLKLANHSDGLSPVKLTS